MLLLEPGLYNATARGPLEIDWAVQSNESITGIDTHGHVFTRSLTMSDERRYTPAYDAPIASYLKMLDENGISHGVLVQPSFLGTDNSYMLKALRQAPTRLRGVAVLPFDVAAEEMVVFGRLGIVGVRLNLIGLPTPPVEAVFQAHLRRLAEFGWLVEVQAEAVRLPYVLPPLLEAGLRVLVDHFGRPDHLLGTECPGFRYLLTLGDTRQVWVKLSGAYRNGNPKPGGQVAATAAPHLHDAFGPDRLVWGSDWPHTGFEQIGQPDAAKQALDQWIPGSDDRRRILVETPKRLFGF